MRLSIIIVSYNTQELLQDCLESLFTNYKEELRRKQFEVIVVDNCSTDNSVKTVQRFSEVKIIKNKENKGFAKANNQGIAKSDGDYVLLLNPDVVVYKETLSRMLRYMDSHQDVGIVTCKVLLPNGQLDDAAHRGFPTPWRALMHFSGLASIFWFSQFFNGYHLGYQNMDNIHEIDACAGAFLLVRKSVGDEVGWLDEDYFWYGDDLDLCYRVKKTGYKVMYVPEVSIMHYKGAASGIKKSSQHVSKASRDTKRLATQARFEVMKIFYKKHYLDMYPRWLTNLVFFGIDLKQKVTEWTL